MLALASFSLNLLLLHRLMMKEAAEPGYDATHAPPPPRAKRLNEGPATETGRGQGGGVVHHITIEVSDLARSREWYQRVLPVRHVARKVYSPLRGEWYQFTCCVGDGDANATAACCCDDPATCRMQLHLVETAFVASSGLGTSGISAQHIALDLGPVGLWREHFAGRGVPATLAPQIGDQHAIFVTDPDQMTWEFTHEQSATSSLALASSPGTIPPNQVDMRLNRSYAAPTPTDDSNPFKASTWYLFPGACHARCFPADSITHSHAVPFACAVCDLDR